MLLILAAVPAEGQTSHATASPSAQPQLLQPGDMVRLQIWRQEDLSGEYQVDEDGVIVFPLIGPVQVGNRSPAELKEQLTAAYQVYLRYPAIDITLLRRVSVLGSVGRPGLYSVDPTMSVADVIALAGGVTAIGTPDRVDLLRDGEVLTSRLTQGASIADLAIRSGDQLFVPERNWISRNSNIVAATITGTITLVIALIRL